ncbi:MAG TPA: M48 family metalloprotease [Candidatus Polarisedimenticolaceae bacterium]|nr:M48 family metalloprotease [Candidatus Polarisedimenticolaceae bacterium]
MRKTSRVVRAALASALFVALSAPAPAAEEPGQLDAVLDEIVARERELTRTLEQYRPLIETYMQTVEPDVELGLVPVRDRYFLGRLSLGDAGAVEAEKKKKKRTRSKLVDLKNDLYSASFKADGFSQVMVLDRGSFDRETYDFFFVRREFIGEIRTLVFDVAPKHNATGRFTGRIWVEDRDHHIVRYNGLYTSILDTSFRFDSWRLNMAPGLWLPAYVYTEKAEHASSKKRARSNDAPSAKHTSQTRIWGYQVNGRTEQEEFTKVLVDAPLTRDRVDAPGQVSPVESMRAWEREAEENVVRRLERAALLAPEGPVDQVLETVVANLEVTNGLAIEPPIRCRVLMTTPLESFTVGHTIILSRGLIDVLPDEASLAMVLAHEMGHVLSGHRLDTTYAFSDQMLLGDREAMEEFVFERHPEEEREADARAIALLQNSPYKDKLANAGLFLKALATKSAALPSLIRAHFGNRLADAQTLVRMNEVMRGAPELDETSLEQIAALPLGGRVKVDPWSARIELMTNNGVALVSAREKMPFMVTPLMPYLARYGADGASEENQNEMASSAD